MLCIYIGSCDILGCSFCLSLEQHRICQSFQSPRTCDGGTRALFLLVGAVEIFEGLKFFGCLDRCAQFICQLALVLDACEDLLLPFDEAAQIREACLHLAQCLVFKRAGRLLAVACDERDRVAVIEQCDDGFDLLRTDGEFARNRGWDIGNTHGINPFFLFQCPHYSMIFEQRKSKGKISVKGI